MPLSTDLHSPGSAHNEDDSGVSQDSHQGDGTVEYWEQHNDASLEILFNLHIMHKQFKVFTSTHKRQVVFFLLSREKFVKLEL